MRGTTTLLWCEQTRVLADGTRVTMIAAVLVETAPRPIGAVIDVAPVRESAPVLELRRAA
jgi:hypothetical protein